VNQAFAVLSVRQKFSKESLKILSSQSKPVCTLTLHKCHPLSSSIEKIQNTPPENVLMQFLWKLSSGDKFSRVFIRCHMVPVVTGNS
ncbi:hypothetical protein CEXT_468271, partial [Caerostris extrusa]